MSKLNVLADSPMEDGVVDEKITVDQKAMEAVPSVFCKWPEATAEVPVCTKCDKHVQHVPQGKASDQDAVDEGLTEYAFDCTILTTLRIKTKSKREAESIIRSVLDAASCKAGVWPDGSQVIFEASIEGEIDLIEVNGEPV